MKDRLRQGETLFADGKIEKAEKCFLKILEHDPQNKEVLNNLGVIAFQSQQIENAIDYFDKSLKLDPFYKDAVLNYTHLLKELKLLNEASPFLYKIMEKYPNDKELNQLLNEIEMAQKPKRKIAVLCLPGLESFLQDIVDFLQTKYEVLTCYSNNNRDIEAAAHWADVVWIEWANELAIALTNHPTLLDGKHIICRLHSYETLAGFVQKVKWEKIDDLIFVAEHIKDIVLQQDPSLHSKVTNILIIPNGVNLDKLVFRNRSKGKNLAYLGHINYKKGPMLLLHAFRELLQADTKYRLFIAGDFQDARYQLYFNQMIKEMDLARSIQFDGWVDDVAHWLEDKHYIVCTSVLEGHPVGIMEAMACGLKPVIHNFVGAKDIYPEKYLWNTIPQFVEKVTEPDYDPITYRNFIKKHYSLSHQMDAIAKILSNMSSYLPKKDIKSETIAESSYHNSTFSIPLPEKTYSHASEDRHETNQILAEKFFQMGDLEKARLFASRSLLQSAYKDDNAFELLNNICSRLKDYQALKELYKRKGITHIKNDKFDSALKCFELSINGSYYLSGIYDIIIDFEIIDHIHEMAESLKPKFPPFSPTKRVKKCSKINIGYIIEGFDCSQAPIKNYMNYAQFHEKELFNITFYSRWGPDDAVKNSDNYNKTINFIKNKGHQVVISPQLPNHFDRVLFLFEKIKEDEIDILSTSTLYTTPYVHLLCALKPAPFLVKDVMQQPELSCLPDLTIHHSVRTLIEDVGKCINLNSYYTPPPVSNQQLKKSDFKIPINSILLASSGRSQKFVNKEFWKCIGSILSSCHNVFYIAIGLSKDNIDLGFLNKDIRQRIILPGFCDNVVDILTISDIYIDTFPQGGGYSLAEAMFVGLPCVMFCADYLEPFGVSHLTYSEILRIPELIVPPHDYNMLIALVITLIKDHDYRKKMSKLVKNRATTIFGYNQYIKDRERVMIENFFEKVRKDRMLQDYYVQLEDKMRRACIKLL